MLALDCLRQPILLSALRLRNLLCENRVLLPQLRVHLGIYGLRNEQVAWRSQHHEVYEQLTVLPSFSPLR